MTDKIKKATAELTQDDFFKLINSPLLTWYETIKEAKDDDIVAYRYGIAWTKWELKMLKESLE